MPDELSLATQRTLY